MFTATWNFFAFQNYTYTYMLVVIKGKWLRPLFDAGVLEVPRNLYFGCVCYSAIIFYWGEIIVELANFIPSIKFIIASKRIDSFVQILPSWLSKSVTYEAPGWFLRRSSSCRGSYTLLPQENDNWCREGERALPSPWGQGVSVDSTEMAMNKFRFQAFHNWKHERFWIDTSWGTYGHMYVSWWGNKWYLIYCLCFS